VGGVCFEKLLALGFTGSARTVRRAVASARWHYRLGRVRVFRPWLPEPGMWLQFDWPKGPPVGGARHELVLRVVGAEPLLAEPLLIVREMLSSWR
jgi:hypothetical protein